LANHRDKFLQRWALSPSAQQKTLPPFRRSCLHSQDEVRKNLSFYSGSRPIAEEQLRAEETAVGWKWTASVT
jgi:hypothetical protein